MGRFETSQQRSKMEEIHHRTVSVNGIKMHIAEKGEGRILLFIHGFPELWYSWRRQILAFSSLGYHAIAPDLRGYGDTEAPDSVSSYSCLRVVGDLVALIDTLGAEQVFLVAHDWGAIIGWFLCLFRPDRIKAYVTLTIPFMPRNPIIKTVEGMRAKFGDDYYICRFQEPGEAEAMTEKVGTAPVLKKILAIREPGPPKFPEGTIFGISPETRDEPITMPPWLSEEDLDYYVTKYDRKGFTGPLSYYRALDLNWELTAAWTGAQVKVPVKFIVGGLDMTYTTPGVKQYVHGGGFKSDVPLLEEVVVIEGAGHFIMQERPEEINTHIYDFISKF